MGVLVNSQRFAPAGGGSGLLGVSDPVVGATTGPTLPAHSAGDLLLLYTTKYSAVSCSTPSGWTVAVSYGTYVYVFYKIATSSSETVPSLGWPDGVRVVSWCEVWGGIDNTTPMDATALKATTGYQATVTTPTITTVTDGAYVVSFGYLGQTDTTVPSLSVPNGFTDSGTAFNQYFVGVTQVGGGTAYKQVATAGATSGPTWTSGGGFWWSTSLALRPA